VGGQEERADLKRKGTVDEREKLLRQMFGEDPDGFVERPERAINTTPLFSLREIWPDVVERLKTLLTEDGRLELAASVEGLQVYDRCRCGVEYCATVYTKPRPSGGYGPTHRNLVFWNPDTIDLDTSERVGDTSTAPTTEYTTILDVVSNEIACIEILNDADSRRRLIAALPDEGTTDRAN
jgi:hypothetical protein